MAAYSQVGTVPYTAPETFATDRVSKQTDVYAFGILRAHPPAPLPSGSWLLSAGSALLCGRFPCPVSLDRDSLRPGYMWTLVCWTQQAHADTA